MMHNKLATTFALTAAALFVGGCGKKEPTATPADATAATPDPNKKVKCYGVNECSGQTVCGVTGKWDCAGNNDCCGKGWIQLAQAECDAKGGGQDESFLENVPGICDEAPAAADSVETAEDAAEAAPAADAAAPEGN